jgi:hypothetical protein
LQSHGRPYIFTGTAVERSTLGGVPFGKMTDLEALGFVYLNEDYKGCFSSLLRCPSLKLLQIHFQYCNITATLDTLTEDVAGRKMDQVETLVLILPCRIGILKWLDKLLTLFPSLKSLRIAARWPHNGLGVGLGRLVRKNLPHLSELVLEHEGCRLDLLDFSANVPPILRGLGSQWTMAPVAPTWRCPAVRFVAAGRDSGEFSIYFFEDEFFKPVPFEEAA